jgi:hypothetical protein
MRGEWGFPRNFVGCGRCVKMKKKQKNNKVLLNYKNVNALLERKLYIKADNQNFRESNMLAS